MLKFSRQVALLAFAVLVSGAAPDRPATINIPFERYTLPNGLTVILSQDHDDADGRGQRLVSRRLEERGARPDRLRAPVRARDVHRLRPRARTGCTTSSPRASAAATTARPTTIGRPTTRPCRRTISRRRSGSKPTAWASCSTRSISPKLERAARHREERAPAELRQPAVRPRRRDPRRTRPIPASHPYSWDVIGSMADLSAASEEDVKSFFRLYYAPNNAFLSIVGDFDPAQAKAWVAKYFGGVPRGKRDHAAEGRSGDADRPRSGSSSRTACRCRGSTCSGRRSA